MNSKSKDITALYRYCSATLKRDYSWHGDQRSAQTEPKHEAEEAAFQWPPLESDPQILTDYMHSIGMSSDWTVGEVLGLDEDLLALVPQPVVAVIVAVERLKKEEDEGFGSEDNNGTVPFYMKQTKVLDNACGVIACLHAILNNVDKVRITQHGTLDTFWRATQGRSPQERATILENSRTFQEQHCAFAARG